MSFFFEDSGVLEEVPQESARRPANSRRRAYELYEQRGKRYGHALDDWLQAEEEVVQKS
jgi:hypothetical protein